MEQTNTCNICCDDYNKSTRKKICCKYCDFDACKLCCETYMLSEPIPKCMNTKCGQEWTRKFIREHFTGVFINTTLKKHYEEILFEQEKAFLPDTQIIVERKRERRKYQTEIEQRIKEINETIHQLLMQKQQLKNRLDENNDNNENNNDNNNENNDNERHAFVRQCPSNDCRGFLSSQWKCGLCEQWTCPECHEVKGMNKDCEHICDPNSVISAKLLAKETKSCPKCQSLIFKISGCNQMWCTKCHTAFDWKTKNIIVKHIHNPHYFEWTHGGNANANNANNANNATVPVEQEQDTNPDTNPDTNCGLRDLQTANNFIRNYSNNNKNNINNPNNLLKSFGFIKRLTKIIRYTIHNTFVELPNYNINHETKNQYLRERFLCQYISEERFKSLIQCNDKKHRYNREVVQVLQFVDTAVIDITFRIIDLLSKNNNNSNIVSTLNQAENSMIEFDNVIIYCNDIFKEISFVYGFQLLEFDHHLQLIKHKKTKKTNKETKEVKVAKAVEQEQKEAKEEEEEPFNYDNYYKQIQKEYYQSIDDEIMNEIMRL